MLNYEKEKLIQVRDEIRRDSLQLYNRALLDDSIFDDNRIDLIQNQKLVSMICDSIDCIIFNEYVSFEHVQKIIYCYDYIARVDEYVNIINSIRQLLTIVK